MGSKDGTCSLEVLLACRSTPFFLKREDFHSYVCTQTHIHPRDPLKRHMHIYGIFRHSTYMFTVYIDIHAHIGSRRAHPHRHIMNLCSHTGTLTCKHLLVSVHAACQGQKSCLLPILTCISSACRSSKATGQMVAVGQLL